MKYYIIYFVKGYKGRFVNIGFKQKVIIGQNITKEGYYIGTLHERDNCFIFTGEPYIPSKDSIPSFVHFDPNKYHNNILQSSIHYFLARHGKSSAYFVICSYNYEDCLGFDFADLLTFINEKCYASLHWPFQADRRNGNLKLAKTLNDFKKLYGKDFEIVCELNGSCDPERV